MIGCDFLTNSSDGFEFVIEKEVACASGFVNRLLHNPTKWKETSTKDVKINLDNIKGDILEIVIKYFYFKAKYDEKTKQDLLSQTQGSAMISHSSHDNEPPDFGAKNIPPQKVVQVLLAAHYLDC